MYRYIKIRQANYKESDKFKKLRLRHKYQIITSFKSHVCTILIRRISIEVFEARDSTAALDADLIPHQIQYTHEMSELIVIHRCAFDDSVTSPKPCATDSHNQAIATITAEATATALDPLQVKVVMIESAFGVTERAVNKRHATCVAASNAHGCSSELGNSRRSRMSRNPETDIDIYDAL